MIASVATRYCNNQTRQGLVPAGKLAGLNGIHWMVNEPGRPAGAQCLPGLHADRRPPGDFVGVGGWLRGLGWIRSEA
jgi:hypothetical protein